MRPASDGVGGSVPVTVEELRLEVSEFEGLSRWRWALTDAVGGLLAEHRVRADDTCWQFEAFLDLPAYLRLRADPADRVRDEARMTAAVAEWMGQDLLGPLGAVLATAAPVVVRVSVPGEARRLMFCPLELAHVHGRPLALQGVTLVFERAGSRRTASRPGHGPPRDLRVLGLFSQPSGASPLNLRRERRALTGLFAGLAAAGEQAAGRAVEFHALQYGVTREHLAHVLAEGGGWDVVHISGHGAPGELLLEREDGSEDPVGAHDLTRLLRLTRDRLKLVTVSACWSAALTVAAQRRLLGLRTSEGVDGPQGRPPSRTAETLATALVDELDCAVLAMRYPVADDFATDFASRFYRNAIGEAMALPQALGAALGLAVRSISGAGALAAATPALFGARSGDLLITPSARHRAASSEPPSLSSRGFGPLPERFVGRTGVMARSSAALAPRSGMSGVLLHGMPGGGKTACALELASVHERSFDDVLWFTVPDEDTDRPDDEALGRFVGLVESRWPEKVQLAHTVQRPGLFTTLLGQVTDLCAARRCLVVLDNVESLLTAGGHWKDRRWQALVNALTSHGGLGRVVLTSRRLPRDLDPRVRVEAVDALPLDEALLLTRELPHLSRLDSLPGVAPETARDLARAVQDMAQGHPQLLLLADGQAADPERLRTLLEAGDRAWSATGGVPEGFFTDGASRSAAEDYRRVLDAWTDAATAVLAPWEQDLLRFLCFLEQGDRVRFVIDANWADLWQSLGRSGNPPAPEEGLGRLCALGLVTAEPGREASATVYGVHPGIAVPTRARAGDVFGAAVDRELAAYWKQTVDSAIDHEGRAPSRLIARAVCAAAPYQLRQGAWADALTLLPEAINRNRSRAVLAQVRPWAQAVLTGTTGTRDEVRARALLAGTLEPTDLAGAERRMWSVLEAATARGDHEQAAHALADLAFYARDAGLLDDALHLADQQAAAVRLAGLGPWSQVAPEVLRLQVLVAQRSPQAVLEDVDRLLEHLRGLSENHSPHRESVDPWNVYESLLGVGLEAAQRLGAWQRALELGEALDASVRGRGAPDGEAAKARLNTYQALVELGRLDEAQTLLTECRVAFEKAEDLRGLAKVLGALAEVANRRGHLPVAITLGHTALRHKYAVGEVQGIAVGHHDLGLSLTRDGQHDRALPHYLAAALITALTAGGPRLDDVVRTISQELRAHPENSTPRTVPALAGSVDRKSGHDLAGLLARVSPDPGTAQRALDEILDRARTPPGIWAPHLAAWDPAIAALVAVRHGDRQARDALDRHLDSRANTRSWSALARHFRTLTAPAVNPTPPSPGLPPDLDEIDSVIATRAAAVLDGDVSVPVALWPAMPLADLIGTIVAASLGDTRSAGLARGLLDDFASDGVHTPLVDVLEHVLRGDRDPSLRDRLGNPTYRAIVDCLLRHTDQGGG